MDVFDLFAKISLDTSEYEGGLNAAKDMATGALSVAGGALTAMGAAATAATGALVAGTAEVAAYGDNVDKMSQKLGMSAEAYQEWDAVMQHCGTSIDSMKRGMSTLSKAAEEGSDAFEQLGITQEQIANMSQEELFAATIEGLQQMESGTERTVLAQELLGGSSRELGVLLNKTAEDTAEMRERVHELGGVMSDEAVAAAATFQDNLQDMQTAISGLKRGITSDLLPGFNMLMEGFTSMLIGEEDGVEAFSEGFSSLLDTISDVSERAFDLIGQIMPVIFDAVIQNIPDFFSFGAEILGNIANGIMENSGAIIDAADSLLQTLLNGIIDAENSTGGSRIIEVLNNIVNMIIKNVPLMLRAAQSIIRQLGAGLSTAVRTLVPTITTIVMEIAKALTDPSTITTLLQAVVDIVMSIGQALYDAIPILIENFPTIIENVIDALIQGLPILIEGIVSLVNMVGENLPTIITSLTEKLPDIINMIVEAIIVLLPIIIEGGIRIFAAVAEHLPEIISALINALPVVIDSILNGLARLGDELKTWLSGVFGELGTTFLGWWEQTKQDISAKWNEFITNIKEWFAQIPYNLGYFLADAFLKVLSFADDLWNWVTIDFPNIIDSLVEWFKGLPDRIWEWLTAVIDNILTWGGNMLDTIETEIPKVIDGITAFFEELPDKAFEWGIDMIQGFIDGIGQMASRAWDSIEDFAQGVKDRIGFSEPKTGPLSNFHTYAPDMMDLFAEGIADNEDVVYDQIGRSFDFSDKIGGVDGISVNSGMQRIGVGSADMGVNQPVTVVLELDKVKLAETVFMLNKDESQRMGVQLAYV